MEAWVWILLLPFMFVCCVLCCIAPLLIGGAISASNGFGETISKASGLNAYFDKNQRVANDSDAKDDNRCVICMLDFDPESNDQVVEVNCPGKHVFHTECIKNWVKEKTECPTCRTELGLE